MTTGSAERMTTANDYQQQELAAAVHDMRELAASQNGKKVFLLDVGAPEIGEFRRLLLLYNLGRVTVTTDSSINTCA